MSGDMQLELWLHEYKMDALSSVLEEQGSSVEKPMQEMLIDLYAELVPHEVQQEIRTRIDTEYAAEQAEKEAARKYTAFCVRENGEKSFFQDHKQAYRLFVEEALGGNALAMHDLGRMLADGVGIDADAEQSRAWYAKALSAFQTVERQCPNRYVEYRIGRITSTPNTPSPDSTARAEVCRRMTGRRWSCTHSLRHRGSPMPSGSWESDTVMGPAVPRMSGRPPGIFPQPMTDSERWRISAPMTGSNTASAGCSCVAWGLSGMRAARWSGWGSLPN